MTTVTSHEAEMVALALPSIAAAVALVATGVAAYRHPSLGNGWAWMGLALLGDWAPVPSDSPLGVAPELLMIAAVVMIGVKSVRLRLCDALDGFILALGLVAIWSTLDAGQLLPLQADVSAGAVMCQIGCSALLTVAGLTALRERSRPLVLLGVAAALLAASELPHAALSGTAGLPSGGPLAAASAVTSVFGYLMLSWSAIAASNRAAPNQLGTDPLFGVTLRSAHLYALPYLPLAAAIGTTIVQRSLGASPTSTTLSLLLAATALTLARQYLTLRDNRKLADAVLAGRSDLHRQSRQDPVTGLANRVVFTSTLAEALARQVGSGRSLAVVVCDVDGFRSLNDALGQAVGDRLLAEVGARITEAVGCTGAGCTVIGCTGRACTVARLGGDEFAVLLDDLHAVDGTVRAMAVAATLHDRLATTSVIDGVPVSLGVAVGVAVVHAEQAQAGADEVLGRADVALHTAKRNVRRRPVLHHHGMSLPDDRDWLLRPAFDQALRSGAVLPHFQPLVDLDTGRIMAFEALARWTHGGQVTGPDIFVPVAARAGLLPELATQMLRSAAEQLLVWRTRPEHAHLQVAVNVAPNQFADLTFPALVDRVLDEVGLPASGLVLEITEECLLDDQDGAARVISALRQLGVTVWLDDFGAGYSSLALLHRLPLQGIKLDKTLICDIEVEPHLRRLVSGLVSLGGDLGLEVIAEGIQHWAQERTLRQLGCTLGQGFLFAPAAASSECEPLLRRPVLYTGVPRLVG